MKTKLTKILPVAAIGLALGLGMNGQAHAYAYAYADVLVQNGSITFLPPGSEDITDFGLCVGTTPACAAIDPDGPSRNGLSIATVGATVDTGVLLDPSLDTPLASVNSAQTENTFTATGDHADNNAWADAEIISEQSLGDPPVLGTGAPNIATYISTRSAAEANSIDPTQSQGSVTTGSTTDFTTSITINGDGANVRFDLQAIATLIADITAPHNGVTASAQNTVKITITASGGSEVFSWTVGDAPTAAGGAYVGALNYGNDFAIAGQLATNNQSNNSASYNGLLGDYFAVTNTLVAGTYTVKLSTASVVNTQAERVAVPEPTTLSLLALGLLGAAGVRRVTQKRAA